MALWQSDVSPLFSIYGAWSQCNTWLGCRQVNVRAGINPGLFIWTELLAPPGFGRGSRGGVLGGDRSEVVVGWFRNPNAAKAIYKLFLRFYG